MHDSLKRAIFWTPRALAIIFAVFISLFALDVFGGGRGFWPTVAALLIHLIPTYLVLIALAVAWRWEWVGAVLFAGLGVWYIVMAWGQFVWVTYAMISGPVFFIGVLFAIGWIWRGELRTSA